jgi:hypothetical protein
VRLPILVLPFLLLCSGGCLQRLAIDQTSELLKSGGAALNEETDYEYAAQAIPSGLVTTQGLWSNAQDSRTLLLLLAQNYSGYSFGFIEDLAEAAAARGEDDEAQRQYRRARRFYLRGRRYGLYLLELDHEGFAAKMRRPIAEFERYLDEEMDEDDVPALFWTAYGWASAINVSRDDIAMIADLAIAQALVQRCFELDPEFYGHGPVLFLANVFAGFPEALGGNPERGREMYERVIRLTHGHDLLPIYMLAKTYAVQTQNRPLFERLLRQVIDTPDHSEAKKKRLTNAIARRRARRLLAQMGELFYE